MVIEIWRIEKNKELMKCFQSVYFPKLRTKIRKVVPDRHLFGFIEFIWGRERSIKI